MVEHPYRYQRRELAEPDWRRLPGWAAVTSQEWESAQWQRAHSVKNLRQLRARVGVIFEGSALLRRISVLENVELPLLEHQHHKRAQARDAARELLAEVGMDVVDGDTLPVQLGRAGQRRVALAREDRRRDPRRRRRRRHH